MSRRKQASSSKAHERKARALEWTAEAEADLAVIGDFIARNDASAAERWVLALIETAERAAEMPNIGAVVPGLDREDVRELGLRSYRLVYRVFEDRVQVLSVFERHRSWPEYLRLLEP